MAYCVHMILWIHENHVHKCFSFFNLPNLKKNQLFQDYYYNYFFIAFSWVLHFSLLPSLTLSSAQGTQAPSFLRRPCLFFFLKALWNSILRAVSSVFVWKAVLSCVKVPSWCSKYLKVVTSQHVLSLPILLGFPLKGFCSINLRWTQRTNCR